MNGNTPWSGRYAYELRKVFHDHAARAPRTLQSHLGPSELGSPCDRQVAGKMAGIPITNHVSDPWPSIRGTALHAWAAEAFEADNDRTGKLRWIAEQKVTPTGFDEHPGTADLYDAVERAVVDHKFLGTTSMQKIRGGGGPPRHYVVQLLLYGAGYRALGLPVDRVVLAAYPATAASLDGIWVWERPYTPADDELLAEVRAQTTQRREWAERLATGELDLLDIPASPSEDGCYFCPFYRPESAKDNMGGCPGHLAYT
jgi:hypothetical protein